MVLQQTPYSELSEDEKEKDRVVAEVCCWFCTLEAQRLYKSSGFYQ